MEILSKVIVVPRLSTVQLDMAKRGLDEKSLREKYKREGKDAKQIFLSHERHMKSVELLKKNFPNSIIYRENFNDTVANGASLVIAAGGDDHFKYVSHFVKKTPILGLNSDAERSRGELLEDNIERAIEMLKKGKFKIESEIRIEAIVNGKSFIPGTCIYAIGRADPFGNFRYLIELDGKKEEHKITSGIIIYSGNGTKDWIKGAGRYLGKKVKTFKPTEKKIGWLVRESRLDYKLLTGTIGENEELKIIPLKDNCLISPDAVIEQKKEIQSGDVVTFRISSLPLLRVRIG